MEFLTSLWMPIVLSAIAVFICSSIIWMATPLHKKDYGTPPAGSEEGVLSVLRKMTFAPGMYYFPWHGDCKAGMKDPEYVARHKAGPWALLVVPGGAPSMGKCLGSWFASQVVVAALIAYAAAAAIPMGAGAPEYLRVFRIVGAIALLAHAGMAAHDTIWKMLPWRMTLSKLVDGVVYALVTAGVFGWLWPHH